MAWEALLQMAPQAINQTNSTAGAGIETLGGVVGGIMQANAQKNIYRHQAKALELELKRLGATQEQINQYMGGLTPEQYGEEVNARYENLGDLSSNVGPTLGEFDASQYNVDAYLNPYLDFAQQQATKGFQQAAASRGAPRGGAYDLALANRINNMAGSEYWGNAFGRAASERESAYSKYLNKFNADRMQNQDLYNRSMDMYNAAQGRASTARGAFENYENTRRDMNLDYQNARALRNNAMRMAGGQMIATAHQQIGQGISSQQVSPSTMSGIQGMIQQPVSQQQMAYQQPVGYQPLSAQGENLVSSGNLG